MSKNTFNRGIHPPACKELTCNLPIEKMAPVKNVVIHLSQHIGAPSKPIVQIGDEVKVGQLIAEANGFISANVHSSVSGKVISIGNFPNVSGKDQMAIVIENDQKDTLFYDNKVRENYNNLTPDEMKNIVKEAGITGLGGATFPTHVKLSVPPEYKIDYLIINGAECEPYLTADHRVMLEKADEIIDGIKMVMKILEVNKAYIGVENNKLDAIKVIKEKIEEKKDIYDIEVKTLEMKYPQGGEKQLIYAITGKEVPKGALPPKAGLPMHVGAVVLNIGTVNAIYEAIKFQKPLYERVLTVTGYGINEQKNLLVRVGTKFCDIIEHCKGYKKDISKIICGGPMMGYAQHTDMVSTTKGTSGILFFPESSEYLEKERTCINCASCVDACPQYLNPTQLGKYSKYKKYEETNELDILNCIECGSCSYVCPSKIPLVQYIRIAKQELNRIVKEKNMKIKEAK